MFPGGVAASLHVSDDLQDALAAGGDGDVKAERSPMNDDGGGGIAGTSSGAAQGSSTSKPKRGRSSYILFSSAVREELKRQHPEASIGELSKLTGLAWKGLGPDKKRVYADLAAQDKTRYEQEMAALDAAGGAGAARAAKRPRKSNVVVKQLQRQRRSSAADADDDGFIDERVDRGVAEDDDGMDASNIVTGSRTRTQRQSYAEGNADGNAEDDDDDEEREANEDDEEY
jgi:hypothetical protein